MTTSRSSATLRQPTSAAPDNAALAGNPVAISYAGSTAGPARKRVLIACAATAVLLHMGVVAAFYASDSNKGNANDAGEYGVTVGLGQQGGSDDLIQQLTPPSPEPTPEPEPEEKPQPEPDPITEPNPELVVEPEPTPEPVPEPAPVPEPPEITETDGYQIQQTEPEPTPEPQPPAAEETQSEPVQDTVASQSTSEQPQSDVASVKRTGRADHESTGGKFGNARDYIAHVMSWLMQFHRYPTDARKNKEEGIAKVTFRFNRDGFVIERRIASSSGSASLDQAALAMFDEASPLPPVPPEFFSERETLLLSAPVEYKLTD